MPAHKYNSFCSQSALVAVAKGGTLSLENFVLTYERKGSPGILLNIVLIHKILFYSRPESAAMLFKQLEERCLLQMVM